MGFSVNNNGVPSLPPPGGEDASGAETAQAGNAKNSTLPQIHDEIANSVNRNEEAFNHAYRSISPHEPFVPTPFIGSSQGDSGGKLDPTGRGNPWLVPNPVVYIQTQMLALYETLRQSNLMMAKYELTTMELNTAYAEVAAALIIQAGESEAHMAMLEGIAAGIAAGASALALGFSAGGFYHGMTTGKTDMANAKTKMDESEAQLGKPVGPKDEPNANTKAGQYQLAERDFKAKQTKLNELKEEKVALENSSAAGTNKPDAEVKAQQEKAAQLDKDIDAKKEEVSAARKEMEIKREEYQIAQKEYSNYHTEHSAAQQQQFQMFNNVTQMAGMGNTLFSQGAAAVTKLMSTEDITEKAMAQATQQVVDALRENIKQSGQAASQTQQQTKDAMNSLIQALEKLVSETTRAMTMGRN